MTDKVMYEIPTTHVRPRGKQSEEELKWAPLRIADALERIAVSHEAATEASIEMVKTQRQMLDGMAEPEASVEVAPLLGAIDAFSQGDGSAPEAVSDDLRQRLRAINDAGKVDTNR